MEFYSRNRFLSNISFLLEIECVPIEVRQCLRVGFVLNQFLCTAVQQTNVWVSSYNSLAKKENIDCRHFSIFRHKNVGLPYLSL